MSGSDALVYRLVSACRICKSSELNSILDLGDQPPANALYGASGDQPPAVPLELVYCSGCCTVQLSADIDPKYLFAEYLWVTGTSQVALQYAEVFVERLDSKFSSTSDNKVIVEVASNDGTFLKAFQKQGWDVFGVDPADNICNVARADGVPTKCAFFDDSVASSILEELGTVDAVVARNVIPHVKDIHGVIKGMARLIGSAGIGVIEFHKSSLLLEQMHYDYIYHEHLFYFSLKTMGSLLARHGLALFDVDESPISGGSWVVYFAVSGRQPTKRLELAINDELQRNVDSFDRWQLFADQANLHRASLVRMITSSKLPILAYGASARSSTLVNWCGFSRDAISAVIDKNPLKVGLICPGSDIPVVGISEIMPSLPFQEVILILAWNFKEEIMSELREYGFKGEFIVPLPVEVTIQ